MEISIVVWSIKKILLLLFFLDQTLFKYKKMGIVLYSVYTLIYHIFLRV